MAKAVVCYDRPAVAMGEAVAMAVGEAAEPAELTTPS